jgi:hypothetical protein
MYLPRKRLFCILYRHSAPGGGCYERSECSGVLGLPQEYIFWQEVLHASGGNHDLVDVRNQVSVGC